MVCFPTFSLLPHLIFFVYLTLLLLLAKKALSWKKKINQAFFHLRSKHEEIDLVTEEEFYKEAPPEISRPQLTKNDTHQLTLARLDWELEQRKRCENLFELLR